MKLQPVMINPANSRRVLTPPPPYDRWFILSILSILSLGLLMVASASIDVSDHQMRQPFYFFYKQLIYIGMGVGLGSIVVQFNIEFWEKIGGVILIVYCEVMQKLKLTSAVSLNPWHC
jgi:cell division protein FtsW (lipid II flippase)